MKTKTEAAKILLEKGWTFEEIERVLGREQIVINPPPVYPVPIYPQPRPYIYPTTPFRLTEIWADGHSSTTNGLKFTVTGKSAKPS